MAGQQPWKPKKVRKDKPSDSPKNYLNPFRTELKASKRKRKPTKKA